jgi:hypothetical protein
MEIVFCCGPVYLLNQCEDLAVVPTRDLVGLNPGKTPQTPLGCLC